MKTLKGVLERKLSDVIVRRMSTSRKAIIVYGPRQVGKTTMLQKLIKKEKVRYIDADLGEYRDILESHNLQQLKRFVEGYDFLFIDEAQRLEGIGKTLKIIHDHLPDTKVIATGSSAFDLAHAVEESMAGRFWSFEMHPLSLQEISDHIGAFDADLLIEDLLIYGSYPEVYSLTSGEDRSEYLRMITSSYLYKDVLELSGIRHSSKLKDLLRLLAYQVGSLVSFNELGRQLGMSTETVQHYIDLLEKSFVIKSLNGYSTNLRNEITRMSKFYFYDLGIRNALIDNFKSLAIRNDKGQLWENFLFIERQRYNDYNRPTPNHFFWRLYSGAELDYLESKDGSLDGYEFKWKTKRTKAPKSWAKHYPDATFMTIDRQNYLGFVGLA